MIAVVWGIPAVHRKVSLEMPLLAIAKEVAQKHGLTVSQMFSRRHQRALTVARQEAYWRARNETTATFPEIGKAYGNRDHSTIIYGARKHEQRMSISCAN